MNITELKGIGAKTAENFNRLSVYTVSDLVGLYHIQKRHPNRNAPHISGHARGRYGGKVQLHARVHTCLLYTSLL